MKASRILLGLLTAAALGILLFTGLTLAAEQEHFTVRQESLLGDASALEGLTLHQQARCMQRFLWDSDSPLDGKPWCDFHLDPDKGRQSPALFTRPVDLFGSVQEHVRSDYSFEWPEFGLNRIIEDMARTLAVGGELETEIDLRDYFDCYPLGLDIQLPGAMLPGYTESISPSDLEFYRSHSSYYAPLSDNALAVYTRFGEFFRIPIQRPFPVKIHITRNGKDSYDSSAVLPDPGAVYSSGTLSTFTSDQCFFTIEDHLDSYYTEDGEMVSGELIDTSLIPGGYGLYAFSYHREHSNDQPGVSVAITENFQTGVEYETLRNVCPLRPDTEVLSLTADEDHGQLRMITREAEGIYLTVLALDTDETVQRLLLSPEDVAVSDYSDFLAAENGFDLTLFSRNTDGCYLPVFTVTLPARDTEWYKNTAMAYNGEKLAVFSTGYPSGDYFITVADKTGILYHGTYGNSLHLPLYYDRWEEACEIESTTLSWDTEVSCGS